MSMFDYHGPVSSVSLRLGDGGPPRDVTLHPGQPVDLPADHEWVHTLVARRLLTERPDPAPTSAPEAAPESAPGGRRAAKSDPKPETETGA